MMWHDEHVATQIRVSSHRRLLTAWFDVAGHQRSQPTAAGADQHRGVVLLAGLPRASLLRLDEWGIENLDRGLPHRADLSGRSMAHLDTVLGHVVLQLLRSGDR